MEREPKRIIIRVNPWEYDLITENARASGMTVSQFLRAVGKNIVVTGDRKYQFATRNEVFGK